VDRCGAEADENDSINRCLACVSAIDRENLGGIETGFGIKRSAEGSRAIQGSSQKKYYENRKMAGFTPDSIFDPYFC
jgi:hypothetical protein